MTRKIISIFIVLAILINTAGCSEEWRKKFVRKKKEVTKKPRIWQEKRYPNTPTEAIYSKHYNYAITWLSQLSDGLGQNNKKDVQCIEEALGQIYDMQSCLVAEKSKEMDKHVKRLEEVRDTLKRGDLEQSNKDYVRGVVDREERFIRSDFYYNKIKSFMRNSFDEEGQDEPK